MFGEFLDRFSADELETGPNVALAALQALGAAPWRWLTLNVANASLTVIRYRPERPAALVAFNDTGHLTQLD